MPILSCLNLPNLPHICNIFAGWLGIRFWGPIEPLKSATWLVFPQMLSKHEHTKDITLTIRIAGQGDTRPVLSEQTSL